MGEVWAHNPDLGGSEPPQSGWRVPHDGPIDTELRVLVHVEPEPQNEARKRVRGPKIDRESRTAAKRAREQQSRTDKQKEAVLKELRLQEQKAEDQKRQRLEEERRLRDEERK